jgi:hypothetical protein
MKAYKKIKKEITMKKILTTMAFLVISFALIVSAQATCLDTTWNLTAGQTINVGMVTVNNDADNMYVTYTLTYPGATFGTLHMWAGNNLLNVPANNNGTPVPGQFCSALGGACYDATGLTTHTFTIPFSDLNIADATATCGSTLYVVTHAEVTMDSNNDGTMDHETAFGGPTPGEGQRWWFYGSYTVCCDFGQPPQCFYETAFAKGGYVWTTDKKSNPEKLPSLSLTKNRWGWAINLIATGTTTYDIWAGAGLNKTANGVKVGTLTVAWDGANGTVTYDMVSGYYLEEVHIYASDTAPYTTAPGQYGYPTDGYDVGGVDTYSYTLPLADTNGTGGVWLIVHAVVSNGYCD